MILTAKRILELNEKHKLIEGLSERELKNPEGVGFDLRAGEVYKLSGEGFLGVAERRSPEIVKIADIKTDGNKVVVMAPGDYFLVKTVEQVHAPAEKIVVEEGKPPVHLMIHIYPRSTLHRCGVYLMGTKTDPGYKGELTFAIANLGGAPFRFELGARMLGVVFKQAVGDLHRAYDGQWKGGRVSTGGTVEKQN
ncbi:MAG: hypothetical protein V1820_03875 [archaeon]